MGLLLSIVVYNLYTLPISPLPWYDEICLADISYNFLKTGKLLSTVTPFYIYNEEVTLYGPLYFYIQSLIVFILGFTAYNFRLLNLISSFLIVFILYKKKYDDKTKTIKNLLIIMLSLSPMYIANSHSGRMDLFSSLFVFLAFTLLYKDSFLSLKKLFAISALLTLSILITPRVMFLSSGLIIFYLRFVANRTQIVKSIVFAIITYIVPILAYCTWSYYSSGDFLFLIQRLLTQESSNYVGSGFVKKNFEFIILLMFIVLFILTTIKHRKLYDLPSGLLMSCLTFQFFVKETGPYTAMQVPFAIWGIMELMNKCTNDVFIKYSKFIIMFITFVFFSVFCFKTISIYAYMDERNVGHVDIFIEKNKLNNKIILAAFPYYYELMKNKNTIYNYEITNGKDLNILIEEADKLAPEYLMCLRNDTANKFVKELIEKRNFTLIDSLVINASSSKRKLQQLFKNNKGYNSYEGYLYKKDK